LFSVFTSYSSCCQSATVEENDKGYIVIFAVLHCESSSVNTLQRQLLLILMAYNWKKVPPRPK